MLFTLQIIFPPFYIILIISLTNYLEYEIPQEQILTPTYTLTFLHFHLIITD